AVRLHHAELADDVANHWARRGGGERQDRHAAELRLEAAQPPVRGPEVVAPFRDTVRLVDGDQRHAHTPEHPAQAALEPPGGAGDQLVLAASQALDTVVPGRAVERRVQHRGAEAGALERVDLVLHQRDERAHDDDGPVEEARGDLVGERLAGAGRHHADAVAAAQHGGDDLLLPGTEVCVPEDVAQDVTRRRAGSGKVRVDGSGRYHADRGGNSSSATSGHATPASPDLPASREVLPASIATGFRRSSERNFLLATLAVCLASRCDLVLGHLTVVVGVELVEALGGASLAGTGHLVECQDAIAVLVQLLERRTVLVAVVGKGARGREESRGTEHRDNELPHG